MGTGPERAEMDKPYAIPVTFHAKPPRQRPTLQDEFPEPRTPNPDDEFEFEFEFGVSRQAPLGLPVKVRSW